jgi:hypothetical protein
VGGDTDIYPAGYMPFSALHMHVDFTVVARYGPTGSIYLVPAMPRYPSPTATAARDSFDRNPNWLVCLSVFLSNPPGKRDLICDSISARNCGEIHTYLWGGYEIPSRRHVKLTSCTWDGLTVRGNVGHTPIAKTVNKECHSTRNRKCGRRQVSE